ncbi:hypothetical protein [Serratia marcescens]|uniref:hypothetical protein n=1 Tax=Serratia marcescens TaxID=615 RepID=UPI0020C6B9B2|nr:hypothetical protein [Serratia marcescens]
MSKELKLDVMNNKNDLIEGTFCYSLFEMSFFDEKLLSDLINNSEAFLKENECDKDVLNLLSWVSMVLISVLHPIMMKMTII